MSEAMFIPRGTPIVLKGSLESASRLDERVLCPLCNVYVFVGPKQQSVLRTYADTNPVTILCPACAEARDAQDPLASETKADNVL